jgi:hypothetical protein
LADDGERKQLEIDGIDAPPGHLYIFCIQSRKLNFFLGLLHDLMDKEFPFSIDKLAMGDPGDDLVHKHLLALLEQQFAPVFEPERSALPGLPQHVDDDRSSVFLSEDLLDEVVEFFHDELVL